MLREVKESFMLKEALVSSGKISRKMALARQFWYGDYLFNIMMRDTVDIIISEVVNEAMEEGLRAKFTAENISGIRFPDPEWMQYDMYATLAASWRRRKEFLRMQIALKFGPKGPGPSKEKEGVLDEDKEKRLQQIRRNERAEKRRQKVRGDVMLRGRRRDPLILTYFLHTSSVITHLYPPPPPFLS